LSDGQSAAADSLESTFAIASYILGLSFRLPATDLLAARSFLDAVTQDWLVEFERVQLLLRCPPRLRQLHGDSPAGKKGARRRFIRDTTRCWSAVWLHTFCFGLTAEFGGEHADIVRAQNFHT
jgi:hypothetical protein